MYLLLNVVIRSCMHAGREYLAHRRPEADSDGRGAGVHIYLFICSFK